MVVSKPNRRSTYRRWVMVFLVAVLATSCGGSGDVDDETVGPQVRDDGVGIVYPDDLGALPTDLDGLQSAWNGLATAEPSLPELGSPAPVQSDDPDADPTELATASSTDEVVVLDVLLAEAESGPEVRIVQLTVRDDPDAPPAETLVQALATLDETLGGGASSGALPAAGLVEAGDLFRRRAVSVDSGPASLSVACDGRVLMVGWTVPVA